MCIRKLIEERMFRGKRGKGDAMAMITIISGFGKTKVAADFVISFMVEKD